MTCNASTSSDHAPAIFGTILDAQAPGVEQRQSVPEGPLEVADTKTRIEHLTMFS